MPFWFYRKVFCACSWRASVRYALKAFPGMTIALSHWESVSHIGMGEASWTGKRNTQEVSVPGTLSGRVPQGWHEQGSPPVAGTKIAFD
jgi:hypothetical protein